MTQTNIPSAEFYIALCGGVGGAKLAAGLARKLGNNLCIVVNTGDDFEHLGLSISPDIDTVLYTLSGRNDVERGWGRTAETWSFMEALAELGAETWFRLGDKDLAIHVERSRRLAQNETLSAIVTDMAAHFAILAAIVPMTDSRVRTIVETDMGPLAFQRYFVEHQCRPAVKKLWFEGGASAKIPAALAEAFKNPHLAAILICPSNPYLSIDPILAVPAIAEELRRSKVPVVAVSPLIGGKAVKGPTAKIMGELGLAPSCLSIARHYSGIIDGLVMDEADREDAASVLVATHVTKTLMVTPNDQDHLAKQVLQFAAELASHQLSSRPD